MFKNHKAFVWLERMAPPLWIGLTNVE